MVADPPAGSRGAASITGRSFFSKYGDTSSRVERVPQHGKRFPWVELSSDGRGKDGEERSVGGRVGEPRGEGSGVHVEHHIAEPVGSQRRETLAQDGLLRRAELAAQAPLELMPQRLEGTLLDAVPMALLNGLIGSLGAEAQPAAEHLGVDAPLLFGVGRDVQVFVQFGSHREGL